MNAAMGLTASALTAAGLTGLVLCALRSARLRAFLRGRERQLDAELRYLQLRISARTALSAELGAVAVVALASALGRSPHLLALAPAVVVVPAALLARARRERTTRIEQQLDGFLLALANTLHANPALASALRITADVLARPMSDEVAVVLREHHVGVPLERALDHFAERTRSPVVSVALATLRIAGSTGGDVSQVLERSAASLREMARLEGLVRSKTAEGRAQALVVALAPGSMVTLLHWLDPDLLEPLWSTDRGRALAAAALLLWGIALVLARKIAAVEV